MKDAFIWGFKGILFCLLIQFFWVHKAQAVADFGPSAVLPEGRYQAALRFGNVSDIQDKYAPNGTLNSLSRLNQRMSNDFLQKVSPDFKRFVSLMNSQNPLLRAGSQMDPGALQIDGAAEVNYMAPQIARGMTSKWTLGLVVPIVNFKASVTPKNIGPNNAGAILDQFGDDKSLGDTFNAGGGKSSNMIRAIRNGPAALLNETLKSANDEPIGDRNLQFVGDVYLASIYQIYQHPRWSLFFVNLLELPTGPKPNPDDLMTIPVFGRTSLQNTLYNNFYVNYWLTLGLGLSYTWRVPDNVTLRVPRYEGDFIPPESTKQGLNRDLGDTIGFQLASMFSLTDNFQMGLGYEMEFKGADRYHGGNQGTNYGLLSLNTQQEACIGKFKMSYSTVQTYLGGKSKIPYTLTYALSDLFAGVNAEHQLTNELIAAFYF